MGGTGHHGDWDEVATLEPVGAVVQTGDRTWPPVLHHVVGVDEVTLVTVLPQDFDMVRQEVVVIVYERHPLAMDTL